MVWPNDNDTLPDPATYGGGVKELADHIGDIFGPWRASLVALRDKVGLNGSSDATSLDYKVGRRLAQVYKDGVAQAFQAALNFTGAGVTVSNDATNGRTNINIPGGGGGGGGGALATYVEDAVVDWGADPTGNNDSTTALNNLGDYMRSITAPTIMSVLGGTAIIPPGKYLCSGVPNWRSITGWRIQGYGVEGGIGGTANAATTIIHTGTGRTDHLGGVETALGVVDIRSCSGVIVSGITFGFNNPNFKGTALDFSQEVRTLQINTVLGSDLITTDTPKFRTSDVDRAIRSTSLTVGGVRIWQVISSTQARLYQTALATSPPGGELASIAATEPSFNQLRDSVVTGIGTRGGGGDGNTGGSGGLEANITRLVGLRSATIMEIVNCHFGYAARGIDGTYSDAEYGGYSVAITINHCSFGQITQAHIAHAGWSWVCQNNVHEGFWYGSPTATYTPAYADFHLSNSKSNGMVWTGSWCGDANPDFWIRAYNCVGWFVGGNMFVHFVNLNATPLVQLWGFGNSIIGNQLGGGGPAFDTGGGSGLVFMGNSMGAGATEPPGLENLHDIVMIGNSWGGGQPSLEQPSLITSMTRFPGGLVGRYVPGTATPTDLDYTRHHKFRSDGATDLAAPFKVRLTNPADGSAGTPPNFTVEDIGSFIEGTGIPPFTKITAVDSLSQVTIDQAVTATTGPANALTIRPLPHKPRPGLFEVHDDGVWFRVGSPTVGNGTWKKLVFAP